MNVIALKSTNKLIKGKTYKVISYNPPDSIRIKINEESSERFNSNFFEPENGKKYPTDTWVNPEFLKEMDEYNLIDEKIKIGDYVKVIHDRSKLLIKNKIYKVEDLLIKEITSAWFPIRYKIWIKPEGSKRFYNSNNFFKVSDSKSREIAIQKIIDEKVEDLCKIDHNTRKLDLLEDSEKYKILKKIIIKSAQDRFRNGMDCIDWAIKTNEIYKLRREDFDPFMSLTLKEFLLDQ